MTETWISVVVSIGSLMVAVFAIIMSYRTQNKHNDIQSRLLKIEEEKQVKLQKRDQMGELRAEIQKTGKNNYRLRIRNSGQAAARNVAVCLDGKPFKEHCAAVSGSDIPERIGPGGEASCLLATNMTCAPPFNFKVTWDDDFEEHRLYETTLTF